MKVRCCKVRGSTLALVVLVFTFVMSLSFPFSATGAQPISKDEAPEILMNDLIKPSSSFDRVAAYMLSEPLQANDIVSSDFGSNYTINNDTWFIFIDDYPSYMFAHSVRYVFMDAATGSYTVENETWWPSINNMSMWNETLGRGEVIEIYSILGGAVPEPAHNCTGTSPGDYGDAPDGQEAYWGVNGSFPTLFSTNNSKFSRPGAHTLNVGQEMLGNSVTKEDCATDPNDPDNVSNIVDADSDDRMFVMIENTTAKLVFDVTVNAGAPNITRYVNVLVDFDQNGNWSGNVSGKEWAIVNMEVNVAPGTNETIITQNFSWWNGSVHPSPVWMRVSLTREKVNETLFSVDGWDGSGQFQYGEIEDFFVFLMASPLMQPAPVLPPENKQYQGELGLLYPDWWFLWPPLPMNPPGGQPSSISVLFQHNPPPPAQSPGPKKICTGIKEQPLEINYYALIIDLGEPVKESWVSSSCQQMYKVFKEQGYKIRYLTTEEDRLPDKIGKDEYSHDATSKESIYAEIFKIRDQVKCGDRVFIYFSGHSANRNCPKSKVCLVRTRKGPKGPEYIAISPKEIDDWLSLLIKPCPAPTTCGTLKKCCNLAVMIDTCFSGQFINDLKKDGRIIITSTSRENEQGARKIKGYTVGFIKDLRSLTANENHDKDETGKDIVDVKEAHKSAKKYVEDNIKKDKIPRPQNPDHEDKQCKCKCPPCQNPTQKPSDPSGTQKFVFPECNPVYVIGDLYPANTTLPIYVVQNTTWTEGMPIPTRVPETATTITTNGTGQIPPTKIWTSAVKGEYDIIVDVNNDGLYNATIDALADNNVDGAGFVVIKATRSPVASFTEDPETPYEGQPVTFNASTSQPGFDGDDICDITEYSWDFGDGEYGTSKIVTHIYDEPGEYIVTLTVYAPPGPNACPEYNPYDTTPQHIKIVRPVGGYAVPINIPINKPTPLTPWSTPILALSTAFAAASIATLYKRKRKGRKASQ